MKANTKKTSSKAVLKEVKKEQAPKKVSKTWLAMLNNIDEGNKILDMRAVLK